jgi:hypothetical protein
MNASAFRVGTGEFSTFNYASDFRMTLNSARNEINLKLKSKICHDGNTINNLEQRGNTASTAHFIAMADHIRNGNIKSGDKIVFSISASGLTIGTAYMFLTICRIGYVRWSHSNPFNKKRAHPIS